MNLHSILPVLVGLAVFVWILYRQLGSRPVGGTAGYRRPVVFGAIGLVLGAQYALANDVTALAVAGLAVSLLVAAGLAYVRAASVRLWRRDGEWWRQGTALTLVLWFLALGSHLGIDAGLGLIDPSEGLGRGLGNATLLLYLGVSLGLQQLVVLGRIRRLEARSATEPVEELSRLAG